MHFLRKAIDYLPRKGNYDRLIELWWLYDRRDLGEARRDLGAWLSKCSSKYPKLCQWVEVNIEKTFAFSRLPSQHPKHLKSTNMLKRLDSQRCRPAGPTRTRLWTASLD